jgi:methionyl aminopeptidase
MILLKKQSEIEKMRAAGRVVARTQRVVSEAIVAGRSTPQQLDELAERLIREAGGIPSFKGYRGFPNAACISVNDVVVHGIPDATPLQEGDIIGLDFGVILDGWHADGAWTYAVGAISQDAQRLLNVSQEALFQGIAKARVGARVGDISAAVQKYVESNGYAVVRDLVGHGIGRSLHEEPSVPNFGRAGKGPVLREGTTICIEPMVNAGTWRVTTMPDGWTMKSADGSLSAHFEHTVAITRNGPEILTLE